MMLYCSTNCYCFMTAVYNAEMHFLWSAPKTVKAVVSGGRSWARLQGRALSSLHSDSLLGSKERLLHIRCSLRKLGLCEI